MGISSCTCLHVSSGACALTRSSNRTVSETVNIDRCSEGRSCWTLYSNVQHHHSSVQLLWLIVSKTVWLLDQREACMFRFFKRHPVFHESLFVNILINFSWCVTTNNIPCHQTTTVLLIWNTAVNNRLYNYKKKMMVTWRIEIRHVNVCSRSFCTSHIRSVSSNNLSNNKHYGLRIPFNITMRNCVCRNDKGQITSASIINTKIVIWAF